jgi:hypothetical protein
VQPLTRSTKPLAVLLALALPACSFAFGRVPAQPRVEDCPKVAPIADVAIAAALLVTSIVVGRVASCAWLNPDTSSNPQCDSNAGAGLGADLASWGALIAIVPYGISAGYGFHKRGQCMRRATEHAAATPVPAPDPASP